MKTVKYFIYILSAVFFMVFVNCADLNYDESTGNDKADIFNDVARSKAFVTGIYAYLPIEGTAVGGTMRAAACDEAEHVNELSSVQKFNDGSWSAIQQLDNIWPSMYAGIRASNVYLKESKGQDFIEQQYNTGYIDLIKQIENYPYEVRFLRSFFYFELIKRYKNVPLITSVLTPDEAINVKETSFNDIVDFIVTECDIAAANLPINYSNFAVVNETGRATAGAAMALKARVLLYAASPLHNETNEKEKWVKAAVAAKSVMDLKVRSSDVYSLGVYTSVVNSIASPELIFERREGATNTLERLNFPIGIQGGNTGICPTQNLVDSYEMLNGIPSSYNPQIPYGQVRRPTERDPRLGQTIITNGSIFRVSNNIELFFGGANARPISNASKTGYYLKKHLIESILLEPTRTTTQEHTWTFFRYGEVLLNYAEAMNEAFGPDNIGTLPANSMTARTAVNLVRTRSKMPSFPLGMTTDAFRIKLRNERRVELAFEDHRFWDVRRWKIGEETKDIYKMEITGTKAAPVYQRVILEKRVYEDRMNLYPKPLVELIRNKNLVQNPGW